MSVARESLAQDIERRLAELQPQEIEIVDESAHHVGHAEAGSGGHFSLMIVSPRFAGLSTVARHREVYRALGPLMQQGIHALAIRALAPDEL